LDDLDKPHDQGGPVSDKKRSPLPVSIVGDACEGDPAAAAALIAVLPPASSDFSLSDTVAPAVVSGAHASSYASRVDLDPMPLGKALYRPATGCDTVVRGAAAGDEISALPPPTPFEIIDAPDPVPSSELRTRR